MRRCKCTTYIKCTALLHFWMLFNISLKKIIMKSKRRISYDATFFTAMMGFFFYIRSCLQQTIAFFFNVQQVRADFKNTWLFIYWVFVHWRVRGSIYFSHEFVIHIILKYFYFFSNKENFIIFWWLFISCYIANKKIYSFHYYIIIIIIVIDIAASRLSITLKNKPAAPQNHQK